MAKSKAQKAATEMVQQRLTGSVPLRLDVESVTAGKSGSATESTKKTVNEIHPSLESLTTRMEEAGVNAGVVTTRHGERVRLARSNRAKAAGFQPQSLETSETQKKGEAPHPPLEYNVSQRFEQPIGREHGHEKAAALTAEADALAATPNPLRSDGLVDNMVGVFTPSMGGNRLGLGGRLSALAKSGTKLGEHQAHKSLGYSDEVQTQLLNEARDKIARRRGRSSTMPLTPTENQRAYGQVTEHLDEAVHGTKPSHDGPTDSDVTLIHDLAAQQAGGARGYAVQRPSPGEGAGLPPARAKAPTGLGMTKSRTPEQEGMRKAVRALVRQKGGWSALSGPAVAEAATNDLKVLDLRQKARSAASVPPEKRNTMSPGADPEKKARRHAQPVFSTGPAAPFADTSPGLGVGIASETAARQGRAAARIRQGKKPGRPKAPAILPGGRAQPGEISPVPTNLPTEPARLGRTRAERGVRASSWPTAEELAAPIKAPVAGSTKPVRPPKPRSMGAPEGNVAVAQTVVKTKSAAEKRAEQRARL